MRFERWVYSIPLRIRSLFRRDAVERELDDELQFHLEQKTQYYASAGLNAEDARRKALRDIEGLELRKEECRDARRVSRLEDFVQDLRFAVRTLRKAPGFTLTAVITLALGIGANAAIFSFADAVLFRPLPIAQPSELLTVRSQDETRASSMLDASVSFRDYIDFRDRSRSFSQLLAYDMISASLASHPDSAAHLTYATLVSGNFFKVLGVQPQLGRDFRPEEDQAAGRNPVAILSYGAWVNEWEKDPNVLGRTLRLNGISLTIIGVAPESFWGMDLYIRPSV